jgi:hypothetical protein
VIDLIPANQDPERAELCAKVEAATAALVEYDTKTSGGFVSWLVLGVWQRPNEPVGTSVLVHNGESMLHELVGMVAIAESQLRNHFTHSHH